MKGSFKRKLNVLGYLETEIIHAGARSHIPYIDTHNTEILQQRAIYELEASFIMLFGDEQKKQIFWLFCLQKNLLLVNFCFADTHP